MHSMASENKYLCTFSTRRCRVDWPIFKFILAGESIILSRDGHHVLSVVKNILRISCIMYPKIRLITKIVQWFVCRHLARVSSRNGPILGGPKVARTKNRKFLGFGQLLMMNHAILHYFCNYFILLQYSRQEGGLSNPLWLRPCSWAYQVWEN